MITKQIQFTGMLSITYDESGRTFVQFLPEDPDSIELDEALLNGSAQLLRCGQFEFTSFNRNTLIINKL